MFMFVHLILLDLVPARTKMWVVMDGYLSKTAGLWGEAVAAPRLDVARAFDSRPHTEKCAGDVDCGTRRGRARFSGPYDASIRKPGARRRGSGS